MKKLAGIVSLIGMIVFSNCNAEPNLNDGTLNNAQSAAPVKDLKENTEVTSNLKEIQTTANVSEILNNNGFSQLKISEDELNSLVQSSQQASDIEATSEMWKALSAENQENNK